MSMSYILVGIIGNITITIVVNDQDRLLLIDHSLSIMHPCEFNYKQEQQGDCGPSPQSCNVQES